ncbi:MAG: hypothetical protein U0002_18305 [Thermoanaerobaculia bacterium]
MRNPSFLPFSRRFSSASSLAGFGALLALVLASPARGFEPLSAESSAGLLTFTGGAGQAQTGFADGHQLAVELPPRGEATSFAAGQDEWWAAGVFARGEAGRDLFVLRGSRRGTEALPLPAGGGTLIRRGATLLARGDELLGLAWLEGDEGRALAVKAAAWLGDRWAKPELVSGPGPGSQLGLSGAVLADGSWLLDWSAYDGEDDEVVFARRQGGSWSKPRRVSTDNHVPDITPALAAVGQGALLAWSRYDGHDYRLMLARFDGKGFAGERVAGGPGTLYPSFQGGGSRPRLVHLEAEPRTWKVLELDAQGQVRREAAMASQAEDRPSVRLRSGELELRWAGEQPRSLAWRERP